MALPGRSHGRQSAEESAALSRRLDLLEEKVLALHSEDDEDDEPSEPMRVRKLYEAEDEDDDDEPPRLSSRSQLYAGKEAEHAADEPASKLVSELKANVATCTSDLTTLNAAHDSLKQEHDNLRAEYTNKAKLIMESEAHAEAVVKKAHFALKSKVSELETQLAAAKQAADQSAAETVALKEKQASLTATIAELSSVISDKVELVSKDPSMPNDAELAAAKLELEQAAAKINV